MAIGLITRFPEGAGANEYDAVQNELNTEGDPPDGLYVHCCGELEGRFQVFDIWETREQHDRFQQERLIPTMKRVMGEERFAELPEAERVETEIHNFVIP